MKVEKLRPKRLIAQAVALADGDECDEGLALLHQSREALESVPPGYDATIGKLSMLAGMPQAAIEYLDRAKAAWGGTLPTDYWRILADAWLRLGRVETAGRELTLMKENGGKLMRRSHMAAAQAYQNRDGEELDEGRLTPWHVLARAEALADAKDRLGAPKCLAEHRGDWDEVPKSYDAALCRLALRAGDTDASVEYLSRARDTARGAVPAMIRQALGTALFNVGRVEDAARELSLAMDDGAHIGRLDLRIAVATHRDATGAAEKLETSFPQALTLVDHDRRLVYLSLPKNACTLLKATFVMNSAHREAYLSAGRPIHEFCGTLCKAPLDRETILGPDYFRFVVLREPLRRILSAYLDKFVRRRKGRDRRFRVQQMTDTIRQAQALMGLEFDPKRSISFAEFVRFLAVADDKQFNMHWMPQSRSVGTDLSVYDHVGKVERLAETLDMLQERFGYVHETLGRKHMPTARRHVTKFSETSTLSEPYNALPEVLDEYESGLPMPELFFTPEIKEILERRYAADVALYVNS